MSETPRDQPEQPASPHSMRTRAIAGGALASVVIATPLAIEFGPDIFPSDTPNTPHHIDYPTHTMARLEPNASKVVIPASYLKGHAASTETASSAPGTSSAKHHKKHKAAVNRIKIVGTPKTETKEKEPKPPEMPQPVINPDNQPEIPTPPEELQEYDFTNYVTPEESKVMKSYVTRIDGCSGFLIKGVDGTPIGVRTAEHCSYLFKNGHWGTDANGNTTLNFNMPQSFKSGDESNHLRAVGQAKKMFIASKEDMSKDEVVGAFEGHSMEEVLARANETQMSEEEVEAIEPGTRLANSGWPLDQDTHGGSLHRQESSTTVVGIAESDLTTGQRVKLIWTGMKRNANKAGCSPGNSGSSLFKLKEDGSPVHIGTATGYIDLIKSGDGARAYYEQKFGVKLEGVDFLCGFSYQLPKTEEGALVAEVNSPEDYDLTPERQAVFAFEDQFFDPTYKLRIVNGVVEVDTSAQGKGGPVFSIYMPAIKFDQKTQQVMITGRSTYDGSLNIYAYPAADAGSILRVLKRDPNTELGFIDSVGEVTASSEPAGGFIANGIEFSKELPYTPDGMPSGRIDVVNGEVTIVPEFDIVSDIEAAKNYVRDPNTVKTSLDGVLVLNDHSEKSAMYIKDPLLVHNADGSVVAFYTVGGELIGSFFRNATQILVRHKDADGVAVHNVQGGVTYQEDASGATKGALVGPDNQPMAELLSAKPIGDLNVTYRVTYKDGQFGAEIAGMK